MAENPYAKYVNPSNPYAKYVSQPAETPSPQEELDPSKYLSPSEIRNFKFQGRTDKQIQELAKRKRGNVETVTQGLTMGLGDELTGAMSYISGQGYEKGRDQFRREEAKFTEEHPIQAFVNNMIGSAPLAAIPMSRVVGALSKLPAFAQRAGTAAGLGGVYGFNSGEGGVVNRLENAAVTGGAAGALGVAGPAAVKYAPLVGAGVGGYYGSKRGGLASGGSIEGGVEGAMTGAAAGMMPRIAGRAVKTLAGDLIDSIGGTSPEQKSINRGREFVGSLVNDPASVSSSESPTLAQALGSRGETNLGTLARRPGTTGDQTLSVVGSYNQPEARNQRILDTVFDEFGIHPDAARGDIQGYVDAGMRAADPLYKRANAGGSVAPLRAQYTKEFADILTAEHGAQAEVQQAERDILLAKARQQETGSVEVKGRLRDAKTANSGLRNEQEARDAAIEAQQKLDDIRASKIEVQERLSTAHEDERTGAKGGIWNPRIAAILRDPISKAGMKRGLEIERLKAVEEATRAGGTGKVRYDPTEYAITGTDEAGEPIVGKVPNMKLLNATKKGLDKIIDDHKDDFGNIQWDERLHKIDGIRRNLVSELRGANPDYAKALDTSGDYLSARTAFNKGQKTILNDKMTVLEFRDAFDKLNPKDQEAFKGGIANLLFDKAETNTLKTTKMLSPRAMQKFDHVLGGEGKGQKFLNKIQQEEANRKFAGRVVPGSGSGTMPWREAADAQDNFGSSGSLGEDIIDRMLRDQQGPRSAVRSSVGAKTGSFLDKLRTVGLNQQARDEAGRLLLMSPSEGMAALPGKTSPSRIPFGATGLTYLNTAKTLADLFKSKGTQ